MRVGDERAPLLAALVITLLLALLAGVNLYATTQPCWPWQDEGYSAGGTTCDGQPGRVSTD